MAGMHHMQEQEVTMNSPNSLEKNIIYMVFFYIVSLDCPGVTNKLQGFRVVDGDFDQETVDICSQTIGFF